MSCNAAATRAAVRGLRKHARVSKKQPKGVEALLSRLRHQCQTVLIDGPSLREPQG
jgi:hypothetical protein